MLVDSHDTQDKVLANANEFAFRKKIFEKSLKVADQKEGQSLNVFQY